MYLFPSCLISPKKYPHTSMNLTPSSSHICSTRALIAILLQFLYVAPLPPITDKVAERIICSTLVFFSFPTNFLYLCTVSSLPALLVPTCTNIDPHWPCPNTFSTRSVTCSILASGRQTTTYSPLLNGLSVFRKMESPINTLSVLNAPSITASEYLFRFAPTWSLNSPCRFICCAFLSCLFSS